MINFAQSKNIIFDGIASGCVPSNRPSDVEVGQFKIENYENQEENNDHYAYNETDGGEYPNDLYMAQKS